MAANGPKAAAEEAAPKESGFEWRGEFYPWSLTDTGKDLMIVDHFTKMPVYEFFQLIENDWDRGRGPVMFAMIGCAVRRKHQEWSVERIVRDVQEISLSEDITFIDLDEEDDANPPDDSAEQSDSPAEPEDSGEPAKTSSESPAPESGTSYGSPV